MSEVQTIEMTGHYLFSLNNFKRALDIIDHNRFGDQTIQGLTTKRAQIVRWLVEQRNTLGGWISTQVRTGTT